MAKGNKTFDPEFKTPLTAPKAGKDVGPDVFNIPLFVPNDPLSYVPGGAKSGSIKGGK